MRNKPGSNSSSAALTGEGCRLGVCWCKRPPPAPTTQPEPDEAEGNGGDDGGAAQDADDDSLLLAQHPAAQVNSRLWQASSRLGANSTAKGVLLIRASRFRGLNNLLFNAMAMEGAGGSEGSTSSGSRFTRSWGWEAVWCFVALAVAIA